MGNILNDLINLFYPRTCVICKNILITDEEHLCLDCLCDLPETNYHTSKGNPAKVLFAGYPQVDEVTAFLFFEKEGVAQRLIHSLKYYGDKRLAEYLGRFAALKLKDYGFYASVDVIIPVPLHRKKQRLRGYNQSEIIARGIASVYGCKIETSLIERIIHTKSQTHKSVYERHANVEEVFSLTEAEALHGKHILLVDDVMTTGATISACIEALRGIPEIRISIFSLSIAREY